MEIIMFYAVNRGEAFKMHTQSDYGTVNRAFKMLTQNLSSVTKCYATVSLRIDSGHGSGVISRGSGVISRDNARERVVVRGRGSMVDADGGHGCSMIVVDNGRKCGELRCDLGLIVVDNGRKCGELRCDLGLIVVDNGRKCGVLRCDLGLKSYQCIRVGELRQNACSTSRVVVARVVVA
jgi:hypothetical protein